MTMLKQAFLSSFSLGLVSSLLSVYTGLVRPARGNLILKGSLPMRYSSCIPGTFLSRSNRFVAQVDLNGHTETCHVKNTGRCRELLIPGCRIYLVPGSNPARKTKYDLVAVEKATAHGPLLVNMDAQAPNRVFLEWAQSGHFRPGLTLLKPETTFGASRFDFYWETASDRGFVEVKGVTLEEDGVVRFPDAPTLRGVKHLEELAAARQAGYQAALCFIVQLAGAKYVQPNDVTHPQFGQALRQAAAAGVEVFALGCSVTPDSLTAADPVPVRL